MLSECVELLIDFRNDNVKMIKVLEDLLNFSTVKTCKKLAKKSELLLKMLTLANINLGRPQGGKNSFI